MMPIKKVIFDETIEAGTRLHIPLRDDVSLEMVWCPAGKVRMGIDENDPYREDVFAFLLKPQIEVTLTRGFWISTTPITRKQFSVVYETKLGRYEASWDSPASQFTWTEAVDLCEKLNDLIHISNPDLFEHNGKLSLPTEAQWEYACRAGTETVWYFGNDEAELQEHSWYSFPLSAALPAVGLKKPNSWGIYDVYGMVYEWCLDYSILYSNWINYVDPLIDDNHPKIQEINSRLVNDNRLFDQRTARGGCMSDDAVLCRSAAREFRDAINYDNEITGIRVVLNQV